MMNPTELEHACVGCGRCCRESGEVHFDTADQRRAAAFLGITPARFRQAFGGHAGDVCLRATRRAPCPFLGDDGCAIYPARPEQCRSFPYWPELLRSPRAWNAVARRCPGMRRAGARVAP